MRLARYASRVDDRKGVTQDERRTTWALEALADLGPSPLPGLGAHLTWDSYLGPRRARLDPGQPVGK